MAIIFDETGNPIKGSNPFPVLPVGTSATITAVSVTTSAQSLNGLLTVKSGRTAVELQNLGAGIVYVGGSGVTTSTGRKIAADEAWSPPLDADSDLYVIGSASATLIVTQI